VAVLTTVPILNITQLLSIFNVSYWKLKINSSGNLFKNKGSKKRLKAQWNLKPRRNCMYL
jgi:hypothetical protein